MNQFNFNPKQLDISALRELPATEIAKITAIPAAVLEQGKFSAQEQAEYLECQRVGIDVAHSGYDRTVVSRNGR